METFEVVCIFKIMRIGLNDITYIIEFFTEHLKLLLILTLLNNKPEYKLQKLELINIGWFGNVTKTKNKDEFFAHHVVIDCKTR